MPPFGKDRGGEESKSEGEKRRRGDNPSFHLLFSPSPLLLL
jgi:hypothetical protein